MKSITRGLHRDRDTMYHHSRFCLVIVDYTPTRRSVDSDYCVICKCLLLKIFEVLSTEAWNTAWLGSKIFSTFVQLFIVYTLVKILIYFACVFVKLVFQKSKDDVRIILMLWLSFATHSYLFDTKTSQEFPSFIIVFVLIAIHFRLSRTLNNEGLFSVNFCGLNKSSGLVYSTHPQHHVCACGAKYPTFINRPSTKLFSFFFIFTFLDKI